MIATSQHPIPRPTAFVVTLAVFAGIAGGLYWVMAFRLYPDLSLDIHAILRFGDLQYYPLIDSLARLDFSPNYSPVFEGKGVIQFPLAALLPHAVLFAVFGWAGFVIADIFAFMCFALLLYAILRRLRVSSSLAMIFAFIGVCSANLPIPELLEVFDLRIPRPLVSNTIFFYLLLNLSILFQSPETFFEKSRRGVFMALSFGISASLVLQSYIYFFFAGFAIGSTILSLHLVTKKVQIDRDFLRGCAIASAAFLASMLPFFVQRLLTSPDLDVRLGLFPIADRWQALSYFFADRLFPLAFVLIAMALAVASAIRIFKPVDRRLGRISLALPVLGFGGMTLFLLVTPKLIQPYHLTETVGLLTKLGLFLLAIFLIDGTVRVVLRKIPGRYSRSLLLKYVSATVVISIVLPQYGDALQDKIMRSGPIRKDLYHSADPSGYRSDLNAVVQEINRSEKSLRLKDRKPLLLTNDHHLLTWWIMSRKGDLLMPDVFSVVLNDAEIEAQLVQAARYMGWDSNTFRKFLSSDLVKNDLDGNHLQSWIANPHNLWFVGHNKYQARGAYSYSSLDDYPEGLRKYILDQKWDMAWQLVLPTSVRDRLSRLFERSTPDPRFAPDLIVIWYYDLFPGRVVPGPAYCELSRNSHFQVWERCSNMTVAR